MRDGCENCSGTRGGVPGNENVYKGRVLCDYCHADALKEEADMAKSEKGHMESFLDSLPGPVVRVAVEDVKVVTIVVKDTITVDEEQAILAAVEKHNETAKVPMKATIKWETPSPAESLPS